MRALHKFDFNLGAASESHWMYTVAFKYTKSGNGITSAKFNDEEMAWAVRMMV